MKFSKELRQLREKTELSQKAFAESLSIPLRTYENWENCYNTPSVIVQQATITKIIKTHFWKTIIYSVSNTDCMLSAHCWTTNRPAGDVQGQTFDTHEVLISKRYNADISTSNTVEFYENGNHSELLGDVKNAEIINANRKPNTPSAIIKPLHQLENSLSGASEKLGKILKSKGKSDKMYPDIILEDGTVVTSDNKQILLNGELVEQNTLCETTADGRIDKYTVYKNECKFDNFKYNLYVYAKASEDFIFGYRIEK